MNTNIPAVAASAFALGLALGLTYMGLITRPRIEVLKAAYERERRLRYEAIQRCRGSLAELRRMLKDRP